MNWFRSIGFLEISFILLFAVFYFSYIARVINIGKKLNTGYRSVFTKVALRTLYFVLLIVAILGPSFGESKREIQSVGKDIFIAVDLSQSMNAFDIQPSRLEKVKYEMKNIIDAFHSDRIGIIIFSSEAFVQCPLTYDQNALSLFIETLHSGLVPNAGTDFAPALKTALEKINDEDSPLTQQKSKVIILISDGEDFGEDTEEVAQAIEEAGIKLFTLGVGSEKGSRIRTNKGFKKDRQGGDVVTKLNPSSLKKLAVKTGGKYFEINESQNDVARMINNINTIEGELRDTRQIDVSANKYYYFLALAALLMLIDVLSHVKTISI